MISQYFGIGSYGLTKSKLEKLNSTGNQEEMEKVAQELESVFIYELLKVMRNTVKISDKEQDAFCNYNTIIDMELSKVLSERGFGLKNYILEALNRDKIIRSYQKVEKESEKPYFKNITSGFGMRKHPVFGINHFHKGIDIALPEGSDIKPVLDGKVIYSGFDKGYGNNIVIEHKNGLKTRYAHNMVNLVNVGDVVDRDTIIGKVGKTGITTGPHLHFEVIKDGKPIDPGIFLAAK